MSFVGYRKDQYDAVHVDLRTLKEDYPAASFEVDLEGLRSGLIQTVSRTQPSWLRKQRDSGTLNAVRWGKIK